MAGRALAMIGSLAIAFILLTSAASHADGYALDTGDVLRVSVVGEATYPLEVTVDDRGSISLPLLGDIQARGLTTVALSQAIRDAFRQQKLILEPFVKVDVGQYRPFFISGTVARPGSYPFQPGITVRHALAIAGGFRATIAGNTEPALQIADLRSTRSNLAIDEYRLKVRLARLQAESRQDTTFTAPPDPPIEFGGHLIADIIAAEQAQLDARLAAYRDDVSFLEASLGRARKQADMVAATRKEREKTASLQFDELQSARALRQKGLITNSNVETAERAHTSYRAELAQTEVQQSQVQQEMLNAESELRKKHQTHEMDLITQTQDTEVELGKIQSQIRYVADKLLFIFTYGDQRTFDDLHGSVKISIFRRDQKAAHDIAADENTEVRAGDVIEVSIVANKGFYAPDTSGTTMLPPGQASVQPSIVGQ
ncbi:polysaccharide biosynthesis/export family protein [Mesorhizobium atlanticum]|jgi:protein involved in polysaccharide export with SLBB domain|uniref:Exopolysaccharide biosynthesis protein n=1 Tax=Mesorhizobium atlanticum TaxID=2233532 RepID=A0A330H9R6_9HYPH|nr:polysaccharide biosynthesis/export family protein [Mesorhizobium atlanticum]RAZ80612.1 exopolysaccharide biosynthesis protein [Mesorhizobium atlanticum]